MTDPDQTGARTGRRDPQERLLSASTDNFATDRRTAEAVDDPKYLPPSAEDKEGLINKWPFEAEKKTYQYWDGFAGEAVDATYDRTEDVDGLETYVFKVQVSDAPIEVTDGVQGTYSTDREIWIAMQCLEGRSLRERLRSGAVPLDEVLAIGRAVADALAHAHARGVVHRDVKPDNVLIEKASGEAKVTDFGIVKDLRGESQDQGRLTRTGFTLGSPCYMSPAQAAGRHDQCPDQRVHPHRRHHEHGARGHGLDVRAAAVQSGHEPVAHLSPLGTTPLLRPQPARPAAHTDRGLHQHG